MVKLAPRDWLSLAGVLALALPGLGCEPTFSDRNSEILERRLLAVKVTPPQAKPKASVKLSALVVEPTGTLRRFALDWAFCNAPKPVAETNDVSAACLENEGEQFQEIGRAAVATTKLPQDACRLFGPDVPPSMAGQPPGRPTDPDATGSYFQPLRLTLSNQPEPILALAQAGLICGLPTLTGEQLLDYNRRVRVNEHPELVDVLVSADESKPLSLDDGVTPPVRVARGERLELRARWPECPTEGVCGDGICGEDELSSSCPADCTTPHGCGGAEPYVYYDPLSRSLVTRREAMRVAWFAGSGSFGDDHTGRAEDEPQNFSDGSWTAPNEPGPAHLWVVLRDSRGGIDWQSYVVEVE